VLVRTKFLKNETLKYIRRIESDLSRSALPNQTLKNETLETLKRFESDLSKNTLSK
jgi:hypothetical protein